MKSSEILRELDEIDLFECDECNENDKTCENDATPHIGKGFKGLEEHGIIAMIPKCVYHMTA